MPPDRPTTRRPIAEGRRLLIALQPGVAAVAFSAWLAPWQFTVLAGWDVTALVLLVWTWSTLGRFDADVTASVAVAEDSSRGASRLLVLLASVTSLIGVLLAFRAARNLGGPTATALTVTGVATVVISWFVLHTVFTLRYAHLYYRAEPGGIDFGGGRPNAPDYRDFAYLAFTIGMTFQVSDTGVSDRVIRRTVLGHALVSFLFGTVIVALTINLTAGLIR